MLVSPWAALHVRDGRRRGDAYKGTVTIRFNIRLGWMTSAGWNYAESSRD
jgi:hypothetical protein